MTQEIFCDLLGNALLEGVWVCAARWGYGDESPIQQSYLWRVEMRNGQRVLAAQETGKVLKLTAKLAKGVGTINPSRVISIMDYPSQWQAWISEGWGIYLMDTFDNGIMIAAHHKGHCHTNRISGADFAKLLRTPGGMEEYLMDALKSVTARPARRKPTKASKPISLVADELIKLQALREQGVLTEEEFGAQKQRLLRG